MAPNSSKLSFGMGGSSHVKHYPKDLFSDNYELKLREVEYTISQFAAHNTLDKFLEIKAKLDFVILFLGGNDIDQRTDDYEGLSL